LFGLPKVAKRFFSDVIVTTSLIGPLSKGPAITPTLGVETLVTVVKSLS